LVETIFSTLIFTFRRCRRCFCLLIVNSSADNFEFSDYILNNYILSDATFPPILWAITEPPTEARTTNGPESFHNHYNAQFYTSHPSIHQVIQILLDIQSESYLKIFGFGINYL